MNDSTPRFLFAGLCVLCLVAIWCGALFEIGRQKRGATISKRHFRWRMMSAFIWTLILGSFAYATLFSWPLNSAGKAAPRTQADQKLAKRFVALTSGATLLILPAFALLAFDFYLTAQTRRLQTARLDQDLGEIARREIEAAQLERAKTEAQNRAPKPETLNSENSTAENPSAENPSDKT